MIFIEVIKGRPYNEVIEMYDEMLTASYCIDIGG